VEGRDLVEGRDPVEGRDLVEGRDRICCQSNLLTEQLRTSMTIPAAV